VTVAGGVIGLLALGIVAAVFAGAIWLPGGRAAPAANPAPPGAGNPSALPPSAALPTAALLTPQATASGEQAHYNLEGHSGAVYIVVFSPDGRVLASASTRADDRTVRLWDPAKGEPLSPLGPDPEGMAVGALGFAPNSRTLVSSHSSRQLLWDLATGRLLRTIESSAGKVSSVMFSPLDEGRTLGLAGSPVVLIDFETGQELRAFDPELPGTAVHGSAFSPDWRTFAAGYDDGAARLWDLAAGELLLTLTGHTSRVSSVAFSPDGRTLATASYDATIRLWDIASGEELRVLAGHEAAVLDVAFSPDGRLLASAGGDETVRLWDTGRGELAHTFVGHRLEVNAVTFSPDGRLVASAGYQSVRLWNVIEP
jgi:WD40 repeat protein